jgi:simple sugar transport system substrate-binding protein
MKNGKMVAAVLFIIAVTAVLTGVSCGKGKEDGKESVGKVKIAVIVKDSASGWFVRMEEGLKRYARDTGADVFMKGPQETDAAQQIELLQNVITQDIDVLCVVPVDPAACESVFREAMGKGIIVICHEGSTVQNCNYDIEAFNNAGYGGYIMDKLAEVMGGRGIYTTMVAFLTNASQNEWADGAVARQKEAYPGMTLLQDLPRVESENNSERAYEVAKEVLKKYPQITGFTGSCSLDPPGIARAINELGLKGKVFVTGTGMPNECRSLIKDGSLSYITLWDPADAGYAMCKLGEMVIKGEKIGNGIDLGLPTYKSLVVDETNPKVLMGAGWISVNASNVDDYDF